MYGMGREAAASKLGITPAEAQSLIRRYLNTYKRIEVCLFHLHTHPFCGHIMSFDGSVVLEWSV
jgi:hypothetical protein